MLFSCNQSTDELLVKKNSKNHYVKQVTFYLMLYKLHAGWTESQEAIKPVKEKTKQFSWFCLKITAILKPKHFKVCIFFLKELRSGDINDLTDRTSDNENWEAVVHQ